MAANPGKDNSVDPDPIQDKDKNTLLHEAAKKGQLDKLRHLIKKEHCDPLYQDENGWTIILYAAVNGHLEVIKFLCDECGINPKSYEQEHYTTLPHLAARNGHLTVLKYLIKEKHCDPKCRNENGLTSLHLAASHGHLQVIQYLIDEYGMEPDCRDDKRRTPLHYAAANQQLNILIYLVKQKGCDPMCRDQLGNTVLDLAAAQHNLLQIVTCLIDECGVDPKVCWNKIMGVSPLLIVNELMRILRFFIKEKDCNPVKAKSDGQTLLHMAAYHGYLNVVQFLIDECGVDPKSCTDDSGRTVVHKAAQEGHVDILKYLINEKQCDPMCIDSSGQTVIQTTNSMHLLQVLQCLIDECGVDPNTCWEEIRQISYLSGIESVGVLRYLIKDKHCDAMCRYKDGQTILSKAASEGQLQIVQCLIDECGVDPVSCLDDYRRSALHAAAIEGQHNIVRYLVKEKHYDPLCADKDGWTALHLAAYFGQLKVVQCLIDECGVDPTCQDSSKYTPLYYAAQEGEVTILRYLIKEKHCDPLSRNKKGHTVLHTTALYGHLKAVECLVDECGVDPKSCQCNGGYAVHYAAVKGHLNVLKYLINEKHCDPMCRSAAGATALHMAAYGGHLQCVQHLIDECGVDPKSCLDDKEQTPLHFAAQQKKLDVVKYLIKEKQCDPTLEDNSGKTALQTSDFFGHLEYVQYLIEGCGVDPKSFQAQLEKFNSIVNEYLKSKGVEKTDMTTTQEEGKLVPSDLHQISSYLHDLPYESLLLLGLALGLTYTKLRRQEKATFLLEMLSMWLREEDNAIEFGPPTWNTLVKALRDKTVIQNGIAQTIEKNHCK